MTTDIRNPYQPDADDPAFAPFAGRKAALARFHQQLTETARREGLGITGWWQSGKTALLRHIGTIFEDAAVCVYVPVTDTPFDDETGWLLALAQHITSEIVARRLSLHRLARLAPPEDDSRAWFADVFLPEIMAIVRPPMYLALLLDDAERLLDRVAAGSLPDDHFAYLYALLQQYPRLALVLTLDAEREDEYDAMRPLLDMNRVHRLTHLAPDETAWLLQQPVAGLYQLTDPAAVHKATGGAPHLLQLYGDALFRRWYAAPDLNVLTAEDVHAVTPMVYAAAEHGFQRQWTALTPNARHVLAAMSALTYADPLRPVTPTAIETWLAETDTPLDTTAIQAALRSLEYRELVVPAPPGIALSADLLQTWLLEHARLDAPQLEPADDEIDAPRGVRGRMAWLLLAAFIAAVAFGIYLLVMLSNLPRVDVTPAPPPAPTVTLAGFGQ